MVVYPISEQRKFDMIMQKFRWSRVTVRRFHFNGNDYNQVITSDMSLLKAVYEAFPINKEEFIRSV